MFVAFICESMYYNKLNQLPNNIIIKSAYDKTFCT